MAWSGLAKLHTRLVIKSLCRKKLCLHRLFLLMRKQMQIEEMPLSKPKIVPFLDESSNEVNHSATSHPPNLLKNRIRSPNNQWILPSSTQLPSFETRRERVWLLAPQASTRLTN